MVWKEREMPGGCGFRVVIGGRMGKREVLSSWHAVERLGEGRNRERAYRDEFMGWSEGDLMRRHADRDLERGACFRCTVRAAHDARCV